MLISAGSEPLPVSAIGRVQKLSCKYTTFGASKACPERVPGACLQMHFKYIRGLLYKMPNCHPTLFENVNFRSGSSTNVFAPKQLNVVRQPPGRLNERQRPCAA